MKTRKIYIGFDVIQKLNAKMKKLDDKGSKSVGTSRRLLIQKEIVKLDKQLTGGYNLNKKIEKQLKERAIEKKKSDEELARGLKIKKARIEKEQANEKN